MTTSKTRSISEDENYATYLGLPLLGLNKNSYGEDNFITAYFTENGKIVACIHPTLNSKDNYWEHLNYLTDVDYGADTVGGIAILYSCPKKFEQDLALILGSQFSKISDEAKAAIFENSGLIVDFKQKDKKVVSSPLIHSIRYTKEDERELPLREQDILDNVDSDITFNVHENKDRKG